MKFMTKLETIIMNRTGCNRETANLVANDILAEVEADNVKEIICDIEASLSVYTDNMEFCETTRALIKLVERYLIAELKKKYEVWV